MKALMKDLLSLVGLKDLNSLLRGFRFGKNSRMRGKDPEFYFGIKTLIEAFLLTLRNLEEIQRADGGSERLPPRSVCCETCTFDFPFLQQLFLARSRFLMGEAGVRDLERGKGWTGWG